MAKIAPVPAAADLSERHAHKSWSEVGNLILL